jgi:hypothetical protein
VTEKHATRGDHHHFCANEGWTEVRSTHHVTFKLVLPDGVVLRTRLSRKPDSTVYGPSVFAHVLRDQLKVSADQFWACADDGMPPDRGFRQATPQETLPAEIVYLLASKVGLSEAEIADMSRDEAIARMNQFWTEGS